MNPAIHTGDVHRDATAVLTGWTTARPDQDELRRAFLEHLAAHPDALAKEGPPVHLTASCLVLDADAERVALTLHRRARRWFQFGGHVEPGDRSIADAAAREAAEESGITGLELLSGGVPVDLDRHTLRGDFGPCREHLDIRYAARAPRDAEPRTSAESLDVRWWPLAALPNDLDPGLQRLISASLRALGLHQSGRAAKPSRYPRARSTLG